MSPECETPAADGAVYVQACQWRIAHSIPTVDVTRAARGRVAANFLWHRALDYLVEEQLGMLWRPHEVGNPILASRGYTLVSAHTIVKARPGRSAWRPVTVTNRLPALLSQHTDYLVLFEGD